MKTITIIISIMIQIKNNIAGYCVMLLLTATVAVSCKKSMVSEEPLYPASPKGIVSFEDAPPTPAIAAEGSIVTIKVNGLEGKQDRFRFYINQTPADIVSVSGNEIRIRIPITASTGSSAVELDGQFYFGPIIDIRGKLNIDPAFNTTTNVAAGEIRGITPRAAGGYLIYGGFRNYQNQSSALAAVTGLAFIDNNGGMLISGAGDNARPAFNIGVKGIESGTVNTAIFAPDGKVIAGGVFGTVNSRTNIGNVTRFSATGALDTTIYDIAGTGADPKAVGAAFNGGFGGSVNKLFATSSGLVAVGNFSDYTNILYERSTIESPYLDRIRISQVARLNYDGGIDSSFNLNLGARPVTGYTSANGFIYDAIEVPGNKLLLVGNFTLFENQPASRIVRIDLATGRRDPGFAPAGPNGSISKITYNNTTRKLMLTGEFTTYNGQPVNGIVMIDENGNIDNAFKFRPVEGGIPNFAAQLKDGKVMVSGTFNKYDGIVRAGFMVLNPDGSLAVGYNNLGFFNGRVNDYVEFASDTDPNIYYVMLVGVFTRFDSKNVGNIVKIRLQK